MISYRSDLISYRPVPRFEFVTTDYKMAIFCELIINFLKAM